MDKAHDIQKVEFIGTIMLLQVDGKKYEIEISEWSERLAMTTQDQRERFGVSPSGYGLHWPDVDEDLSIDGLIGVKHAAPAAETAREFFVDANILIDHFRGSPQSADFPSTGSQSGKVYHRHLH